MSEDELNSTIADIKETVDKALFDIDVRLDKLEQRSVVYKRLLKLILPLFSSMAVLGISSLLSGISINTEVAGIKINLDLETNDVITLCSAAGVTVAASQVVNKQMQITPKQA